jgi:hypothetical protein
METQKVSATTNAVGFTGWLDRRVQDWLDTWAPHCGASRKTFEGQWRAMMAEIFDNIEERAEAAMLKGHKLEGMHYAALTDVRRELKLRSRSNVGDQRRLPESE